MSRSGRADQIWRRSAKRRILKRPSRRTRSNAVGIGETDGEIVFEDATDDRLPGLRPLRKHFAARRDSTALLGGERLAIHAGERLAMNHSYKYAAEAFLQILDQAGLDVMWRGVSDDQRFQMVLAGPK